jgi:hypothetical protein
MVGKNGQDILPHKIWLSYEIFIFIFLVLRKILCPLLF